MFGLDPVCAPVHISFVRFVDLTVTRWRSPHRACYGTSRCQRAPLAQLAEQRTLNPRVRGSSPWRRTVDQGSDLGSPYGSESFSRPSWTVMCSWCALEPMACPGLCGLISTRRTRRARGALRPARTDAWRWAIHSCQIFTAGGIALLRQAGRRLTLTSGLCLTLGRLVGDGGAASRRSGGAASASVGIIPCRPFGCVRHGVAARTMSASMRQVAMGKASPCRQHHQPGHPPPRQVPACADPRAAARAALGRLPQPNAPGG